MPFSCSFWFRLSLSSNDAPFGQSSGTWAQVVAIVAPLMTLGTSKEYMRNSSLWYQFLPLATAPRGILSILVCSICLSGPGFLRRLVGRDAERWSEALVELTPLTFPQHRFIHYVELIDLFYSKSKNAFVCGHVRSVNDIAPAVVAFRDLLRRSAESLQVDRDTEIARAIWCSSLQPREVAGLASSLDARTSDVSVAAFNLSAVASISYRKTGISPTQTVHRYEFLPRTYSQWQDPTAAIVSAILCIGLQALDLLKGSAAMGTVGYVTVVGSTVGLLCNGEGKIVAECETLPAAFENAYCTFGNFRHAGHKPFGSPP